MSRNTEADHGTLTRYRAGCRCDECRAEKAAYAAAWNRSEAGKDSVRRYQATEKGQAAAIRYRRSEKCLAAKRASGQRYRDSEKGRATADRWRRSEKGRASKRARDRRHYLRKKAGLI